jgi:hypothetical protein
MQCDVHIIYNNLQGTKNLVTVYNKTLRLCIVTRILAAYILNCQTAVN